MMEMLVGWVVRHYSVERVHLLPMGERHQGMNVRNARLQLSLGAQIAKKKNLMQIDFNMEISSSTLLTLLDSKTVF